jgi:general secretion pathway protein K
MVGPDHSSPAGGKAARRRRPSNRGVALLMVLWILSLLALMAATVARTSRTEVNLARNAMERVRAEALADAGVDLAVGRLQQAFAQGGWSIDGRVRSLRLDGGEVRIAIADEAGKIDLNGAPPELLEALFVALGHDRAASLALAQAVADFRDGDHLPLAEGAEDDRYLAAGLAYDAKDAPFEDVAELQQVLGMTPELYRRAAPVLTVHSGARQPEAATAPPLVAAVLSGQPPEDGDGGAQDTGGQPDAAGAIPEADESDGADDDGNAGGLRSRLGLYAIHAEGRTDGGAVFARDAVVHLARSQRSAFQTLSWDQGRRVLFPAAAGEESSDQPGE